MLTPVQETARVRLLEQVDAETQAVFHRVDCLIDAVEQAAGRAGDFGMKRGILLQAVSRLKLLERFREELDQVLVEAGLV